MLTRRNFFVGLLLSGAAFLTAPIKTAKAIIFGRGTAITIRLLTTEDDRSIPTLSGRRIAGVSLTTGGYTTRPTEGDLRSFAAMILRKADEATEQRTFMTTIPLDHCAEGLPVRFLVEPDNDSFGTESFSDLREYWRRAEAAIGDSSYVAMDMSGMAANRCFSLIERHRGTAETIGKIIV